MVPVTYTVPPKIYHVSDCREGIDAKQSYKNLKGTAEDALWI